MNQQRLQVDTRKWILSKPLAKKYGDRVDLTHGGNMILNVVTEVPHPHDLSTQESPRLLPAIKPLPTLLLHQYRYQHRSLYPRSSLI